MKSLLLIKFSVEIIKIIMPGAIGLIKKIFFLIINTIY